MFKLCLVIVLSVSYVFTEESLKFAAVVYRHGDRTPVDPYPTDPWRNESVWPVKFGELTNVGKNQHFALGKYLRGRYTNLISDQFDPSEVYVRSTDVDRTLMSAQANLAGLYPPTGTSIWNPSLDWQPIPIHTLPEQSDEILAMKRYCKAYKKEKDKFVGSKSYKDRLSKYQKLMDYLTSYTGRKIKDYTDIEYIYNVLYIESLYNFTLPEWTRSVYPDAMLVPAQYSFRIPTATPLLSRLRVGPLLKEIVSGMEDAIAGKPRKLLLYSAHDDTVAAVLNAMGMFDSKMPSYTAAVFFELVHDNETSQYSVRMYYRNTVDIVAPTPLEIPYCGQVCPLDRYLRLYDNLVSVNWDAECGSQLPAMISLICLVSMLIAGSTYALRKLHDARFVFYHRSVLFLPFLEDTFQLQIPA